MNDSNEASEPCENCDSDGAENFTPDGVWLCDECVMDCAQGVPSVRDDLQEANNQLAIARKRLRELKAAASAIAWPTLEGSTGNSTQLLVLTAELEALRALLSTPNQEA